MTIEKMHVVKGVVRPFTGKLGVQYELAAVASQFFYPQTNTVRHIAAYSLVPTTRWRTPIAHVQLGSLRRGGKVVAVLQHFLFILVVVLSTLVL